MTANVTIRLDFFEYGDREILDVYLGRDAVLHDQLVGPIDDAPAAPAEIAQETRGRHERPIEARLALEQIESDSRAERNIQRGLARRRRIGPLGTSLIDGPEDELTIVDQHHTGLDVQAPTATDVDDPFHFRSLDAIDDRSRPLDDVAVDPRLGDWIVSSAVEAADHGIVPGNAAGDGLRVLDIGRDNCQGWLWIQTRRAANDPSDLVASTDRLDQHPAPDIAASPDQGKLHTRPPPVDPTTTSGLLREMPIIITVIMIMPDQETTAAGATIIFEGRAPAEGAARPDVDGLWVKREDLLDATGWDLKPEGLCRGTTCVPLPADRDVLLLRAGGAELDLAAFARYYGQPVVSDGHGRAWAFGSRVSETADGAGVAAPDFALPDLNGRTHALSDYRGKKVVLYAWATWCSCRRHLPEWQLLHDELKESGFTVLAVATDGGGADAAERWIRAAGPTHPSLIDEWHQVTELYGLLNVPNTVWIDETGQIVRAVEAAGMTDVTGALDRTTLTMPPDAIAAEVASRSAYLDAIRTWVRTGACEEAPEQVRRRQARPSVDKSAALAHHRLGKYILQTGDADGAAEHFAAALRLNPEAWSLRRDAWGLRNQILEGDSMMSQDSPLWAEFWTALDGSKRPFYPATDLTS